MQVLIVLLLLVVLGSVCCMFVSNWYAYLPMEYFTPYSISHYHQIPEYPEKRCNKQITLTRKTDKFPGTAQVNLTFFRGELETIVEANLPLASGAFFTNENVVYTVYITTATTTGTSTATAIDKESILGTLAIGKDKFYRLHSKIPFTFEQYNSIKSLKITAEDEKGSLVLFEAR